MSKSIFEGYQRLPGTYDEFFDANGKPQKAVAVAKDLRRAQAYYATR